MVMRRRMAYSVICQTLDHQAHLWAFVNNFRLFGLLALGGTPLIFLFKRIEREPARSGSALTAPMAAKW